MSIYHGVEIIQNPAIFSGRPIINGHRITVHDVVAQHQSGAPLEEIAKGYELTGDEVAAAMEYYHEHKPTVDRQIAADAREIARKASLDMSPVAEYMRQVGKARSSRQAK